MATLATPKSSYFTKKGDKLAPRENCSQSFTCIQSKAIKNQPKINLYVRTALDFTQRCTSLKALSKKK